MSFLIFVCFFAPASPMPAPRLPPAHQSTAGDRLAGRRVPLKNDVLKFTSVSKVFHFYVAGTGVCLKSQDHFRLSSKSMCWTHKILINKNMKLASKKQNNIIKTSPSAFLSQIRRCWSSRPICTADSPGDVLHSLL